MRLMSKWKLLSNKVIHIVREITITAKVGPRKLNTLSLFFY